MSTEAATRGYVRRLQFDCGLYSDAVLRGGVQTSSGYPAATTHVRTLVQAGVFLAENAYQGGKHDQYHGPGKEPDCTKCHHPSHRRKRNKH